MDDPKTSNTPDKTHYKHDEQEFALQRFERMLDIFGSNKINWPHKEVMEQEKLLKKCKKSKDILSEAVALDTILNKNTISVDKIHLKNRILLELEKNNEEKKYFPKNKHPNTNKSISLLLSRATLLLTLLSIGFYAGSTSYFSKQNLLTFNTFDKQYAPSLLDSTGYQPYEDSLL